MFLRSSLLVCAVVGVLANLPADGATSSTVVGADVPSAISITNSCTNAASFDFGLLTPNVGTTTSTATPCTIGFSSSNDSASLRVSLRDGTAPGLAAADSAWKYGAVGNDRRVLGIAAFDQNVVFAVDSGGYVRRTADAGTTWRSDNITLGPWLTDVEPVPGLSERWVVVGGDGLVRSTTNGISTLPATPATWTSHTAALVAGGWPATTAAWGVAVQSSTNWVITGDNGWMAWTGNAGSTFTTWQRGTVFVTIADVDFVGAGEFVAVTTDGTLYRTTTGGATAGAWTTINPSNGNNQMLFDLSVGDATHVYAASRRGTVYRWNGTTFDEVPAPNDSAHRLVAVASPPVLSTTVTVFGEGGLSWRSADSGLTWARQRTSTGVTLHAAAAPLAARTFAGGSADLIVASMDSGATWTTQRSAGVQPMLDVDANPVDGRRAVAVGADGMTRLTSDGGATWSTNPSGSTAHLHAVSLATSTVGWAVGEGGTILKTGDGGLTWTSQPSGVASIALFDVFAWSPSTAWAVGDEGTVLTTTNGGTSWVQRTSGVTTDLTAIAAISALDLVLTGGGTTLRRSTDGGVTWSAPATPPGGTRTYASVAAGTGTTFVAISAESYIFRSTDNGNTWVTASTGGFINQMIDSSGPVLMTISQFDLIGTSVDNGATWTFAGDPGGWGGTGVAVVDANTQFSSYDYGRIQDRDESSLAPLQFSNYAAGATFGSASTTSTFGMCVQTLGGGAAPGAGWVVDGGTCLPNDADPWKGIGAAQSTVATATIGQAATASFVFGARPRSDQPVGTYSAGVVFEAVAPAI